MLLTELEFAEIYASHQRLAHTYIVHKFGPDFADDAVAHGFQEFWDHRERWSCPTPASLKSLIFTLCWRRASDLYRSAKTNPVSAYNTNVNHICNHPEGKEDFDLPCECTLDREHYIQELQLAITSLPFPQAETIRLVYFEGLTTVEVSQRLQCPEGTVKARLSLAYQKLSPLLSHVRPTRPNTNGHSS